MFALYLAECSFDGKTRQPTGVLLSGESQGQRSLVGYSPVGRCRTQLK